MNNGHSIKSKLCPFYQGVNRQKPEFNDLVMAVTYLCPNFPDSKSIIPPQGSIWQDIYEYGMMVARVIRLPDCQMAVFKHHDVQNQTMLDMMIGEICRQFSELAETEKVFGGYVDKL